MTQFSNSSVSSTLASEKRAFTGVPVSNNKQVNGPNSQVSQKIRRFFRMSSASNDTKDTKDTKEEVPKPVDGSVSSKTSRQSRFMPHIGRNRSTTVASEGNILDDSLSPTANANPYFQHQGPPNLRHHNDGSVPPSPPDTPNSLSLLDAVNGAQDQQMMASREQLARKLRRVASAPNTQGLLKPSMAGDSPTSNLNEMVLAPSSESTHSMVETVPVHGLLSIPLSSSIPSPGQIRNSVAFRRTYSSNSIKVRNVEVGPASFDKIKLIGKGDVGKVYLVREKKSSRLYAMKGE